MREVTKAAVLVLVASVASCGASGRLLQDDAEALVGNRKAGIVAWGTAVEECVEDLLQKHSRLGAVEEQWLALIPPIENKTGEELREFNEAMISKIDRAIFEYEGYRNISVSSVEVALQSMPDVRGGDHLLKASVRRRFVEIMGQEARVPDFLLLAKATSETTRQGSYVDVWYQFHLEMVDVNTGEKVANGYGDARKRYRE